MTSIPASQLVNVIPGVLGAGGNPLSLNSIFLTTDASIPIGTVQAFSTLAAVQAWFGAGSAEATLAAVYFNGFTGATTLPGALYFAQYNAAAVAAYLRGGSTAAMTLAQLQGLSGSLTISINGETVTSAAINLSAATSFSNAAALITTGLDTAGGIFVGTGSIATTTLTISAVTSGALHVGDTISGSGVTGGTTITAFLTGTGGTGTYTVSVSQTASSTTISSGTTAVCSFDSQRAGFVITSPTTGALSTIGFASGTLSAGLLLTSATGAVLSQGGAIAVPATLMAQILTVTQNWATFMTVAEPLLAVKLAFAAWVNTSNQRYMYVAQDSDVTPQQSATASGSFGALTALYTGVCPVWDTAGTIAAFICGVTASLDFTATAGRITYAYKSQSGLPAAITDATAAANLTANGYNFYGSYATANNQFQFLQTGKVSGTWLWVDPYINQIYLNSQLQLAFMSLLANVKSIPYNQAGYNLLRAAALDPINAALNFGTIRTGVTLSAAQIAQVNTAAGRNISDTLQTAGWFLQISAASSIVRAARGSPPMALYYTDGGSIQKITLASIDVL